jgi:hypothetical protein
MEAVRIEGGGVFVAGKELIHLVSLYLLYPRINSLFLLDSDVSFGGGKLVEEGG